MAVYCCAFCRVLCRVLWPYCRCCASRGTQTLLQWVPKDKQATEEKEAGNELFKAGDFAASVKRCKGLGQCLMAVEMPTILIHIHARLYAVCRYEEAIKRNPTVRTAAMSSCVMARDGLVKAWVEATRGLSSQRG